METLLTPLPEHATTRQRIAAGFIVFVVYYLGALMGLYFFHHFETSPAVIWPPVGIGFVAVLLGGTWMWVPIFFGQFLALTTMGGSSLVAIVSAVAYAAQSIVAATVMRRFGFELAFGKMRNALIFVGAAVVLTLVAPTLSTLAQMALHVLTAAPVLNWSRAWAAGIFSALVIVPLVISWAVRRDARYRMGEQLEIAGALILLLANDFFLFWTPYAGFFGISIIFFLPAILIWFALRLEPRWTTLAIFVTSAIGLTGSIVAHPSPGVTVSQQLLSDEVYIGFVAAIFYIFVAVVNERRNAYSNLRGLFERVAAADKAKSDFIAILAHELRNPLAPIVSALELLKLEPQTATSLQTIEEAREHTSMIRRLLDDLLDTARLSQGRLMLQKETVALSPILAQSLASVKDFAASRKHMLRHAPLSREIYLDADPIRLKQIIINLLNNACKYTEPRGTIDVSVATRAGSVALTVRDTGIGMTKETMAVIFDPFRLGTNSRTGTGLGIGLYLTRQLVEMHGGRIEAHSDGPSAGSTFMVYLPLSTATKVRERESAAPRASHKRVLVVDDNKPAAHGLEKLLRHQGHTTRAVFSGEEGVIACDEFAPDVVLLDIGLPDLNGYDVARELRTRGYRGTLVALTGYGQESDRREAATAGFDSHLTKPVGIADVIGELAAHDRRNEREVVTRVTHRG